VDWPFADAPYDVAADGKRFVMIEPVGPVPRLTIRVVQNWYAEFRPEEIKPISALTPGLLYVVRSKEHYYRDTQPRAAQGDGESIGSRRRNNCLLIAKRRYFNHLALQISPRKE